jgi:O-antigen/teichoic acid export membrane protein
MSVSVGSAELSRSFRRGFATTFALDLLTKVIAVATVVVLIRGLSVSSYAYITLFLTIAQFAGSAAGGGVRTRYLREEAERLSRGGHADHEEAFFASLLRGTVLIVAIGACAIPLVWSLGVGSEFGGATSLVAYATAFAAGYSAAALAIARYQARRRFAAAGAISVARAAALLAASAMILVTGENLAAISLWLVGSAVVVGVVAAGSVALRSGSLPLRRLRPSSFSSEEAWLSLYYVAAAGFAYVDVLVAAALLGQYEVATLGASLRYLGVIQSPIPALGAVLRVRTSQVDLVDSLASQRTMVRSWVRRTILPAGVLMAAVLVVAPIVIPQIDEGKYPGSVSVFQIFVLTAFSAYVTAPAASILMAQRRYAFLAGIYTIGLLLNLAGDVVLAPRFGVVGIAVVSTSIYVAIDVTLITHALRRSVERDAPEEARRLMGSTTRAERR